MSEVKMCPICTGSGLVDEGFYLRTSNTWTNAGGTEQCRSCIGRGYIVIPERRFGGVIKKEEEQAWQDNKKEKK